MCVIRIFNAVVIQTQRSRIVRACIERTQFPNDAISHMFSFPSFFPISMCLVWFDFSMDDNEM